MAYTLIAHTHIVWLVLTLVAVTGDCAASRGLLALPTVPTLSLTDACYVDGIPATEPADSYLF